MNQQNDIQLFLTGVSDKLHNDTGVDKDVFGILKSHILVNGAKPNAVNKALEDLNSLVEKRTNGQQTE